jgi:hypothetical protein
MDIAKLLGGVILHIFLSLQDGGDDNPANHE